jgi:hypothetical protein
MNNKIQEHETYILPGTNIVIKEKYMQQIVESFQAKHDGLFYCRNHYVTVSGRSIHVHDAEFFVKTKTGYQHVIEPGFDYSWIF